MTIAFQKDGIGLHLALAGRLDTMTAPQLEAAFRDNIGEAASFSMDFSQLEYISSAGLRVILAVQKYMNAHGGQMIIRKAGKEIMEVFEMTGFADILTLE